MILFFKKNNRSYALTADKKAVAYVWAEKWQSY
jgi:hypothetical protein